MWRQWHCSSVCNMQTVLLYIFVSFLSFYSLLLLSQSSSSVWVFFCGSPQFFYVLFSCMRVVVLNFSIRSKLHISTELPCITLSTLAWHHQILVYFICCILYVQCVQVCLQCKRISFYFIVLLSFCFIFSLAFGRCMQFVCNSNPFRRAGSIERMHLTIYFILLCLCECSAVHCTSNNIKWVFIHRFSFSF